MYTLQSQKIIYIQQNTKHTEYTEVNIRKADKGTTSVFMSLAEKENEGELNSIIDN